MRFKNKQREKTENMKGRKLRPTENTQRAIQDNAEN